MCKLYVNMDDAQMALLTLILFRLCEQQEDPSLRGKPVAVVPTMTGSTSVIAARQKKIRVKPVRVGDAKKCAQVFFKAGNPSIPSITINGEAVEEVLPIKRSYPH
jgi:hypothetical protein